nr:hypothetical protein [Tanacetum cinerariifolium]
MAEGPKRSIWRSSKNLVVETILLALVIRNHTFANDVAAKITTKNDVTSIVCLEHWELVTLPETLTPSWEMEEMEMKEMEMDEIEMEEMVMGTEKEMAITSEDLCLLGSAHIKTS